MKTNFFVLLICSWFICMGSTLAQTNVTFKFKIWKNSISVANYLGEYTAYTNSSDFYDITSNLSGQICPGDQLVIQNLCSLNGSQLSFNGTTRKATIGLTPKTGCSIVGPPANPNPLTHIADVCQGVSGCTTAPQSFNSWNWGSYITINIPAYNPSTGNTYLMFSYGIMGTPVSNCGCGHRYSFTKMNLAPSTSISNLSICPGASVSIPTTSGFSYSNWSPNNPNTNPPTTTTNYTVDITHTATGCTQNEAFKITVENPEVELMSLTSLCYNRSIQISEDDFWNLYGTNTYPKEIYVNGVLIADDATIGTNNLPHVIDGPTYGAGVVSIEYIYYTSSGTCSKTYNLTIHPQIELNTQSTYAFCSNNFQQICATTSGIAQPGITYIWRKSGVPFAVGGGVCFTPSSYGTYFVTGYDQFGCEERRSFTVYDPGVGIKHPANITFCSLTQRSPRYVGWFSDPFGPILYSFNWTYTSSITGSTVSIVNTGPQYQVPYLGPGTYTAVVNANGCTETISITVTDLLQIYTNHSNASFGITPIWGNQASCQPTISMSGVNDIWTVTDQWNNNIATSSYQNGIKFSYTTGVNYTITLRREAPRQCQVFINQFTWSDGANKSGKGSSRNSVENTVNDNSATTIETFPNPTSGLFNIRLTDPQTSTTSIQILNTLGQIILEKEVTTPNNIELDLSKETSGIYLIQVINGDNKFIEKVIKE